MRQLFVHIGPHKTGTTSIQSILLQKLSNLHTGGLAIYCAENRFKILRSNAYLLAHCFIRPELKTPMRLKGLGPQDFSSDALILKHFHDWCQSQTTPRCIVSSEAFSFIRSEAEIGLLLKSLNGLFEKITPIFIRRDPLTWRESWKFELKKMRVYEKILTLPDSQRVDADWYFDINHMSRVWSSFGNIIELNYEDAIRKHRSVVPSFFESIGSRVDLEGDDAFLNRSLR